MGQSDDREGTTATHSARSETAALPVVSCSALICSFSARCQAGPGMPCARLQRLQMEVVIMVDIPHIRGTFAHYLIQKRVGKDLAHII